MTQASKRVLVEDRLSGLPRNVIDRILELLPVHDAARTSILSRNWRFVWAMTPYLLLEKPFFKRLRGRCHQSVIYKIVDKILLRHLGDIVNFVLDISEVPQLYSDEDIDSWMFYVTKHGVKDLTLNMPNNTTYKVPSYIFNSLTLTHLKLINCVVQPPLCDIGFQNVVNLSMENITFAPTTELCVINAPRLVYFTLWHCNGTQYLNMVSSQLKSLVLFQSQFDLQLKCFTNCKHNAILCLMVDNPCTKDNNDERSTLEKPCFSLPTLEVLCLGSFELELLSAGAVQKGLPFTLNCLCHLRLCVHFGKVGQISYMLELIKSSPNLSILEIWVNGTNDNAEAAMKYVDSAACLDRPLNKLEYVTVHLFRGSKTELLLVKLLCARAPSLLRMTLNQAKVYGSSMVKMNNLTLELLRFRRASPMAELFYYAKSMSEMFRQFRPGR